MKQRNNKPIGERSNLVCNFIKTSRNEINHFEKFFDQDSFTDNTSDLFISKLVESQNDRSYSTRSLSQLWAPGREAPY
jgi:hypothetical protein